MRCALRRTHHYHRGGSMLPGNESEPRLRRVLTAFAVIFALPCANMAAAAPPPIAWKNPAAAVAPRAAAPAGGRRHVVLQVDTLPGPAERAALRADGVTLLRYLGSNAFFAALGPAAPRNAAGGARAMEIEPSWKLDPRLASRAIPPFALRPAPPDAGGSGGDT